MDQVSAPLAIAVVAEDEPLLRVEAVDWLEESGFRVLAAPSAALALGHLEAEHARIRLLFTDIQMPGAMDGLALAHLVSGRWPHIVIVICSGLDRASLGVLPEGARFVDKPFSAAWAKAFIGAFHAGDMPG